MARRVPKDFNNMSLLDAVNRMLESTGEPEKSIVAEDKEAFVIALIGSLITRHRKRQLSFHCVPTGCTRQE